MLYFNSFPKISFPDNNGNLISLTNIMERVEIIPSLLKNPLLFYSYDIQEGDTPDIVATKYYGDPNRYWVVLFANQILDAQWEWPLNSKEINDYINNKYYEASGNTSGLAYAQTTIYEYSKIITTKNSDSLVVSVKSIPIDYFTYTSTPDSSTTQPFANTNSSVTVSITTTQQSLYDYEMALNESKRNIKLINTDYVSKIEQQLVSLLRDKK
ncbi:baseplate wedge subunit [uncultured Caudovirales phage]|uniref:Baseplate wedge subunit n=1 Tax=uncultured Caudovirales phage TaxID=2100421 RepID=A0A6J5LEI4_9CAUD|nr:baseplate wedge subunit [uncultured Caudovirales phage]